jgi:uncharacterized small protein (DUF1192 family)
MGREAEITGLRQQVQLCLGREHETLQMVQAVQKELETLSSEVQAVRTQRDAFESLFQRQAKMRNDLCRKFQDLRRSHQQLEVENHETLTKAAMSMASAKQQAGVALIQRDMAQAKLTTSTNDSHLYDMAGEAFRRPDIFGRRQITETSELTAQFTKMLPDESADVQIALLTSRIERLQAANTALATNFEKSEHKNQVLQQVNLESLRHVHTLKGKLLDLCKRMGVELAN